ncbi:FtsK/SpoIIIE domain-containing protein [Streptomyces prasinopilosus]|uniref:FtsK/SpoIIIE domain-containing protein n=1 Tax=Streptomyces prasinopilosus TaxID=67344 RepID=UPI0006EBC08E|nr:FtsK/SpoIIIE domain-containing protein [Streptomyces prasinopilosus]
MSDVIRATDTTAPVVDLTKPPLHLVPDLPEDLAGDLPLIPAWTRTGEGRKSAARRAARRTKRAGRRWVSRQRTPQGHAAQISRGTRRVHEWVVGFHGVNVQAAAHQAHTATREAREAARRARYTMMPGQRDKARQAADRAQTAAMAAVQLHEQARRKVRNGRLLRGAGAYGTPLLVDTAALVEFGGLGLAAGVFTTLSVAAWIGRKPLTDTAWDPDRRSLADGDPLTETMLNRAFTEAKVIGEGKELRLLTPVVSDGVDAWTVMLELPDATVDKARSREVELAAALGIDRAQLDIRQVGGEARMTLWASMRDPFDRTVRSPLLDRREPLNTWKDGIPLAFDKRGQIVAVTISDYSLLFGGATRSGKGMGVANILAGALLDPRVRIRLFDGKGTGEYVPHAPVLHTFVRRNPARLLDFLRVEVEEMNRRTEILVDLGLSKLSEDLIEKVGGIELVVVDELATYTAPDGPSKEYAEEIVEYLAQLAAVGAAVGIVVVLATQYPEVAIVPSRLRGNCAGRMAMRTESADASNTILGKGKAGDGFDSSKIANAKTTRGRGWLTTPDTGMIAVRSLFIDESTGEIRTPIAIGQELRRTAGTLPGHCADPVEDALLRLTGASSVAGGAKGNGGIVRGTVLDHLATAAAGTGRGCLTVAEAAPLLAGIDADRYARRDGETDSAWIARVGKAVKAQAAGTGAELETARVAGPDNTRPSGWTLAALQEAAEAARNART